MRDYLALWKRLRAIIFHVLLAIGLLKSAQLASAGFLAHDQSELAVARLRRIWTFSSRGNDSESHNTLYCSKKHTWDGTGRKPVTKSSSTALIICHNYLGQSQINRCQG